MIKVLIAKIHSRVEISAIGEGGRETPKYPSKGSADRARKGGEGGEVHSQQGIQALMAAKPYYQTVDTPPKQTASNV